jgi:single-strand DNA-binding protein
LPDHLAMDTNTNHVRLVGRVSAPATERVLPSGDTLASWRIVVARPVQPAGGATVDTIDCSAWTASARRAARSLHEGDNVEVTGALRRRFWRGPAGPASRYEVEVATIRRLKAATRTG